MARILLTGAGSGAANSLMRDLRAGDAHLDFVGCSSDRFALAKSSADRNYLVDPTDHPGYVAGLRRIVVEERIDLVIPTSDADVMVIARAPSLTRAGVPAFGRDGRAVSGQVPLGMPPAGPGGAGAANMLDHGTRGRRARFRGPRQRAAVVSDPRRVGVVGRGSRGNLRAGSLVDQLLVRDARCPGGKLHSL